MPSFLLLTVSLIVTVAFVKFSTIIGHYSNGKSCFFDTMRMLHKLREEREMVDLSEVNYLAVLIATIISCRMRSPVSLLAECNSIAA